MDGIDQAHDRFFRALLARPALVATLLRERLAPEVVGTLDLDSVELIDGSFVDAALRTSQADGLLRVRMTSGATAWIYCLIEHKSAPDPRVALQLLRYLVALWTRLDREQPLEPLPLIVPLVMYHGVRRWVGGRRFSDLVRLAGGTAPSSLVDFEYVLIDLGILADEGLSASRSLRAALLALKYAGRVSHQPDHLRQVLREAHAEPRLLWPETVAYVGRTWDAIDRATLNSAVATVIAEDEDQHMSAATEWFEDGVQKGRVVGLNEGKADALLRLLARRFGAIPAEVERRVKAATTPHLDAWLDSVLEAPSLEKLFEVQLH